MTTILKPNREEMQIIANNIEIKYEKHDYINYKNKVCVKPWGYEFLAYESNKIGIWYLNIIKDHGTSLHCHFNKDTIIIVLNGTAKINLYGDKHIILNEMESLNIPKYVFHGLSSYSDNTYFLEIEIYDDCINFSDKNDLLRIVDQYKRHNNNYGGSVNVETENLSKYNYFYIEKDFNKVINGCDIKLQKLTDSVRDNCINVIIEGKYFCDNKYFGCGTLLDNSIQINLINNLDCQNVLSIKKNNYKENYKIIYNLTQLKNIVETNKDKKRILTSGCFDIIHAGHVSILRNAKNSGDLLFVCLSNDKQIKLLKGDFRPVNNLLDRLELLKSIIYVDYIILYDESNIEKEESLDEIMTIINPAAWVKGSDYNKKSIIEKHPQLKNIILFENIPNISTTQLINKIQRA